MLVGNVQDYWWVYPGGGGVIFGTYNICNVQNGRLDSASRGVSQANMDLGIFLRNQVDGRRLHLWIGRLQFRCHRRTNPILRRSRSVPPSVTTIRGGGHP